MKRAIAGILLLVGLSVAPALAWDGDRGLRRDMRHDEAKKSNTIAANCGATSTMATMRPHVTSVGNCTASTAI
jgi:hypothetical protein